MHTFQHCAHFSKGRHFSSFRSQPDTPCEARSEMYTVEIKIFRTKEHEIDGYYLFNLLDL